MKSFDELKEKISRRILFPLYVWIIKHTKRLNDNVLVFMSRPDYSDNSLALSDYIVNNSQYDKYKVVWVVGDCKKFKEKFKNSKISFIQLYSKAGVVSFNALKTIMTARTIFSTHDFIFPKSKSIKGQEYIMLWHGCGYKEKPSGNVKHNFDFACVPGPLFVKSKSKSWSTPENKFIAKGYPRYDWMKTNSAEAKNMAESLKRRKTDKLVIWMPTFRNSTTNKNVPENVITQFPLVADLDAWNALDKFCENNGITLLIKLHAVQKSYDIDFSKFNCIRQISNDDFNRENVQMYSFLPFTDALISDYSSIAVDYLIIDKPIAFALDDFDIYKNLRGFVFDDPRVYMPGHHLYNLDDLFTFLKDVNLDNDVHKHDRQTMLSESLYNSEHFCEDLVRVLNL